MILVDKWLGLILQIGCQFEFLSLFFLYSIWWLAQQWRWLNNKWVATNNIIVYKFPTIHFVIFIQFIISQIKLSNLHDLRWITILSRIHHHQSTRTLIDITMTTICTTICTCARYRFVGVFLWGLLVFLLSGELQT